MLQLVQWSQALHTLAWCRLNAPNARIARLISCAVRSRKLNSSKKGKHFLHEGLRECSHYPFIQALQEVQKFYRGLHDHEHIWKKTLVHIF
jgi:hypothetical protein